MGAISKSMVSVEEYLSTTYDPDCDYVDGEVLERNVGELDHAELQRNLVLFLHERRKQWGIYVIQEVRVQVAAHRFRVPDLCVVLGRRPSEQILTSPPFVCVEVISPKDRISRMQQRIDDYLSFGVRYVWLIDPKTHRAWIYTSQSITEVKDGILRTENPDIVVPLAEIFQVND